jgi:hypothetical protein
MNENLLLCNQPYAGCPDLNTGGWACVLAGQGYRILQRWWYRIMEQYWIDD